MTLHAYFARRFLGVFGAVALGFCAMLLLIDIIEQGRRFASDAPGFGVILRLVLLNLPQSVYGILPLILILTAIALFLSLARSSELVVTRAAGRSAIAALSAPLAMTLLVGIVALVALNPIVAATSRAYEARAGGIEGEPSVLSVSDDGLWLRQGDAIRQTVIRALRSNLDGTALTGVSFTTFESDGRPQQRIDGTRAVLADGAWRIEDAKLWPLDAPNPEAAATLHDSITLPSTLTADQIRDSFGEPSSIPIWELPAFIARLEAAGFAARRHQVHLQTELALPLFLVAMVMIGAAFTMRPQRGGRTGVMVLVAILVSFGIYFVRNFAMILGEAGQIPPGLAAWAPPVAAVGLALGFLLHKEDG